MLAIPAGAAHGQDAEDELGNWLIFNSTLRFTDRWSMFTEGHVRLWEVASNLNELVARVSVHYDLGSPDVFVGGGYVRVDTWDFDNPEGRKRVRVENRLYETFAIRQTWASAIFEHRFRLEQRWFEMEDGSRDYSNRWRYRLQVTKPLNRDLMEPGAYFINFYDEIFISSNGGERSFDQNRLYLAGGHQFTPLSNLQIGLMWQARQSTDFFRLQIFYTFNVDFR